MGELTLIINGASLALSVAKYTEIVQDCLNLKVEQLAGAELEAGLRALQQAATSEQEQQPLLREARGRFNKAVCLEEGFRLAAAYLGLALCHARLGDATNAERAISELAQVKSPSAPNLLKSAIRGEKPALTLAAIFLPMWPVPPHLLLARLHEKAVAKMVTLQQEAKEILGRSLRDGCEAVFGLNKSST